MKIDHVNKRDLLAVHQIELAGFTPAEAGSQTAFAQRIQTIPDTFLVARMNNQIVGFIVGIVADTATLDDAYYEHVNPNPPTGNYLLVLSIAVAPAWQHKGVGSSLLTAFAKLAQDYQCQGIALDSLAKNVPFYERNGFATAGISPSSHAGETWYNMVRKTGNKEEI